MKIFSRKPFMSIQLKFFSILLDFMQLIVFVLFFLTPLLGQFQGYKDWLLIFLFKKNNLISKMSQNSMKSLGVNTILITDSLNWILTEETHPAPFETPDYIPSNSYYSKHHHFIALILQNFLHILQFQFTSIIHQIYWFLNHNKLILHAYIYKVFKKFPNLPFYYNSKYYFKIDLTTLWRCQEYVSLNWNSFFLKRYKIKNFDFI
jgi:hypothetical protein